MKITSLVTMILITRGFVATAIMCVGTYSEYLIMSYMCGMYVLVHST
jgi:hypothetical protein